MPLIAFWFYRIVPRLLARTEIFFGKILFTTIVKLDTNISRFGRILL